MVEQALHVGERQIRARNLEVRMGNAGTGRMEVVPVDRDVANIRLALVKGLHEFRRSLKGLQDHARIEIPEPNVVLVTHADHCMDMGHGKQVGKENGLAHLDAAVRDEFLRIGRRRQLPVVATEEAPVLALPGQPIDQGLVARAEEDGHLVFQGWVERALVPGQGVPSDRDLLGVQLVSEHRVVERGLLNMFFETDSFLHRNGSFRLLVARLPYSTRS